MNSIRPLVFLFLALVLAPAAPAQNVHPGHRLYAQLCATCHGANLQGGAGLNLVDGEWKHGGTRADLIRAIHDGIPANGMPAFGETLDDEQIGHLVDFMEEAARNPSIAAALPADTLQTLDYKVEVEVFADGLEIPWAIDFLDARTALITERPGRLRVVRDGQLLPEPVAGTPAVLHEGQGGLLDVTVDPEYDRNGWVYLAYSHALPAEGAERAPAMTRIVRGKIHDNRWVEAQVLFEAPHETYLPTRPHYGSRIVFDPAGHLYFSIGDRGMQDLAQDLSRPNGKVHRINKDGSIPEDNPFVGQAGALPSIFSYGHRNPQGVAVHPETGEIWAVEHGPRGGDELNRVLRGRNYGWPVATYGINYNGTPITDVRQREGIEAPRFYWRPSIAVSGLDFYRGDRFGLWRNQLLVSALAYEEVRLLELIGDRVVHEEILLKDAGRVREAVTGPDGAVYVVLNEPNRVLRLIRGEGLSAR